MKNSLSLRRIGVLLFSCCIVSLLVVVPVSAQNTPAGIPSFDFIKHICPGSVPSTGTTLPAICVHPTDQNASDVPVVTPGNPIAFFYSVTYRCEGVQDCASIDPATVIIVDDQLPGVRPTVYGQLSGNGDNMFDAGETWGYIVNNRTAIDLTTQGGTLPVPPVTGCAAASGGARPTYKNTAQTISPYTSDLSSTYYCNPVTPSAPSILIEKLTNGQDADLPPGPEIQQGEKVQWTYQVTNNGNVALTGVLVTDSQGVIVTCPKNTLEPKETMICTGSGVAVLGQYANTGTVVGTPSGGSAVSDTDPSHYFGTTKPTPRPVPIPEPVTVILFGTGLAALSAILATRRKKDN